MEGRWVGYGKSPGEVSTGPWRLELLTADTRKEAMETYERPPAEGATQEDDQGAEGAAEDAEQELGPAEPVDYGS